MGLSGRGLVCCLEIAGNIEMSDKGVTGSGELQGRSDDVFSR